MIMRRTMIMRRLAMRFPGQDWLTVTIELVVVVLGVFIGLQAANWNAYVTGGSPLTLRISSPNPHAGSARRSIRAGDPPTQVGTSASAP